MPKRAGVSVCASAAIAVAMAGLVSACSGSGSTTAVTPPSSSDPTAASTASAAAGTTAQPVNAKGASCAKLTDAAATAAIGKATTVKLEPSTLASVTLCQLTITGEVYPVQIETATGLTLAEFKASQKVIGGSTVDGIGDAAFTSDTGVETYAGSVQVQVTGPAGPVLNKDFTIPTAVAKAMLAALG
jgi:hypothetical protein